MREGFACALLFFSVLSISTVHAASWLFWGHGAVGICKLLVCTENRGPLCEIQLRILFSSQSSL